MELQVRDGQKYDCIACGLCCGGWAVEVFPEEETRLNAKPWSQFQPPVPLPEKVACEGQLLKKDGKCLFLLADNKCFIHAKLAEAEKPVTCRQYPFIAIDTLSGRKMDVSFWCPAVTRNIGKTLAEASELKGEECKTWRASKKLEQMPLLATNSIPWAQYEGHEKEFASLIARPELSVSQKLLALYHRAQEICRAAMNAREIKSLDESIAYAQAETQVQDAFKAKLVRGLFLSFLVEKGFQVDRGGAGAGFGLIWNTISHAMGWGSLKVPPMNLEAAVAAVEAMPSVLKGTVGEELMTRYLNSLVWRGRLFARHGLFRGMGMILVGFSLISWFARMSAITHKRPQPALEDVERGVQLTERFFLTHSIAVDHLASGGMFSMMFEALIARNPVASSLILM